MSDGWVTVPRRLSNDLVADIKIGDWEMAVVVAQRSIFRLTCAFLKQGKSIPILFPASSLHSRRVGRDPAVCLHMTL
jgi:hypothetical protein